MPNGTTPKLKKNTMLTIALLVLIVFTYCLLASSSHQSLIEYEDELNDIRSRNPQDDFEEEYLF